MNYSGRFGQTLPLDRLDDFSTLWVSFGVHADNFVLESGASEGPAIVDYMANGGSVYLEGADSWAYDPGAGGFDFRPHFGITATDDGGSDLSSIKGVTGGFTEGMSFVYAGENSYIDHLNPTGDGFALFSNSSPVFDCGIAADAGTYRTIGTSFEFGGLQDGLEPSTKASLVRAVMNFFGVDPSPLMFTDDFESGDCTAWSATVP